MTKPKAEESFPIAGRAVEAPATSESDPGAALRTVDQHAHASSEPAWKHAAAAALHGWAEHAYHTGAPMQLSREAYAAALVSASEPNAQGEYVPHAAAHSPHAPKRETPAMPEHRARPRLAPRAR